MAQRHGAREGAAPDLGGTSPAPLPQPGGGGQAGVYATTVNKMSVARMTSLALASLPTRPQEVSLAALPHQALATMLPVS
jgi:hypothetical protein